MKIETINIPEDWSLDTDEISACVYRVVAIATDGRRIELTTTETELERVTNEVIESIHDSDRQIVERISQAR